VYVARFGLDRETCGAVTGAIMATDLEHGKTKLDVDDSRERTYNLANEFVSWFKKRNKTIQCRELLGHDLSSEEGMDLRLKRTSLSRAALGLSGMSENSEGIIVAQLAG
jgi:hypothetical protein